MPTSNVIVTSASTNSAGQRICIVNPTPDLYLKELIIVPYTTPTPIGMVTPGTATNPVIRTIFVDPHDPVFTTPAPFVLALTYDTSFKLTSPLHIAVQGAVLPLLPGFDFAAVANLTPDDAAAFVVQALAAAAPVLNPLGAGGIAPLAAVNVPPPQGNGHAVNVLKHGKDKQHHAKD